MLQFLRPLTLMLGARALMLQFLRPRVLTLTLGVRALIALALLLGVLTFLLRTSRCQRRLSTRIRDASRRS